ncbi:MAG: tautomerase family protein [Clostridia bacterium]|jgi:4-oxalocrotonate tautomerase|nr:tautomerase family protein [Clostridia bacterium]MBQ6000659.1 tautomerase family protein [Clostridia bacterium]MBQ6058501.1 tautomerase family protein [Clostridia bacterium]
MPYIAIKTFPKDEETKKKVVERINELFLELWGCPQRAITISVEEFDPDEWAEKVQTPEIDPKLDKMMILKGEKKF